MTLRLEMLFRSRKAFDRFVSDRHKVDDGEAFALALSGAPLVVPNALDNGQGCARLQSMKMRWRCVCMGPYVIRASTWPSDTPAPSLPGEGFLRPSPWLESGCTVLACYSAHHCPVHPKPGCISSGIRTMLDLSYVCHTSYSSPVGGST